MSSQLDIIRSFFKSLCESEDLDLAVNISSNGIYKSYDALVDSFNSILTTVTGDKLDDFLKEYCGIDMSNKDSGSPLGIEISGNEVKIESDLVDVSIPNWTYDEAVANNWFRTKKYPYSTEYKWISENKDCLYCDIENFRFYWCEEYFPEEFIEECKKAITVLFNNGFKTGIELNQNTYNIYFDENNTNFETDDDKILCSIRFINSLFTGGYTNYICDGMDYYSVLLGGKGYGTIAISVVQLTEINHRLAYVIGHELNHYLLNSYYNLLSSDLPIAVTEGLAELVVGSKDKRNFYNITSLSNEELLELAKTTTYLKDDQKQINQYIYGFILLRYFMRKCSIGTVDINYFDRDIINKLLNNYSDITNAEVYTGDSENEDEFTSYCFNKISIYLQNSNYSEKQKAELSEYASTFYNSAYKTYYEGTKNNIYYILYRQYEPSTDTSSIQTVYDKYWPIYQQSYSEQSVYSKFWEKYKTLREEKVKNAASIVNAQWNYTEATGKTQDDIIKGTSKQAIRELRPTPGYTNYVVDTRKSLSGLVSSAMLKRYYSNIDAEIYINGEWVEDIGTIQWSIDQQTMPLYGYNSYIFDDLAKGSRIISGSFTLAFTKPRRLEEVIKNYLATNENATTLSYEDMISQLSTKTVELSRNGKKLVSNNIHMPIWAGEKFDVDIVCGEYETTGGEAVHIILKDCYLTGTKSVRSKDGGVAEELYTFIGRDFKTIS